MCYIRLLFFIIVLFSLTNCRAKKGPTEMSNSMPLSADTIRCSEFGIEANQIFEIIHDIDLQGRVINLPNGVTLISKGGYIMNGHIVGNNTKIESTNTLFDNVTIKGTWVVPVITTSLFGSLNDTNSLQNVFALANPNIHNKVIIEEGNYKVKSLGEGDICIPVCSNTDLLLNGTIELCKNGYSVYNIIQIEGESIYVHGNGTIIGDKQTHSGTVGEWGMGIKISNGRNVKISGLTIKDCWGDCIYINKKSKDVIIDSCFLDNGRRQGISLIDADGVAIRNCKIKNIGGTNPQYGIDLEPNGRNYVDNVVIENVTIDNCVGGITTLGRKKNRKDIQIGSVEIRNCIISSTKRRPLNLRTCKKVVAENCVIHSPGDVSAVYAEGISDLTLLNNDITHDKGLLASAKRYYRALRAGEQILPILIKDCKTQKVGNNKLR